MKYNNIDYIQKNPATKEEIITRLQMQLKKMKNIIWMMV